MKNIEYEYRNLPIPGGGYVTGFLFDPDRKNVLYIRTDIGGCYRFSYENRHWDSLMGGRPIRVRKFPVLCTVI